MANLSFRPRPLDVNKKIPIFRTEIEDAIDIGIGRSVPLLPTGMEEAEEAEKHIQDAINRSILESNTEIPTPIVKIVEDYDNATNLKPFIRPQSYIRSPELTIEEQDLLIEYDMDEEDEIFLSNLNSQKKILSEENFELLIDRFEKEASRIGDNIPSLSHCEKLIPPEKIRSQVLQLVYEFWKFRRRGSVYPLLISLLKPPDPEDPSPYKAFRPRNEDLKKKKSRKNDQNSLVKMRQLRQEMERARTLLEQIKKREKLKSEATFVMNRIFELQIVLVGQERERYINSLSLEDDEPISNEIDEYERNEMEKPSQNNTKSNNKLEPNNIYEFISDDESDDSIDLFPEYEESETEDVINNFKSPYRNIINLNKINPKLPPFRGRVRFGRGGRVIFDRTPNKKENGIVHCIETDEEFNSRFNSLVALYKTPYYTLPTRETDPEKLLKKLESLIEKKKRYEIERKTSQNSID